MQYPQRSRHSRVKGMKTLGEYVMREPVAASRARAALLSSSPSGASARSRPRTPLPYASLRKLLLLLVIVGLLLAALDVAVRLTVESQLEARLAQEVPQAGSTDVSVHSFPFLLRLLLSGDVSGVSAEVTDLPTDRVTFDVVSVDLDDVRVDRDVLVSDRQIELENIGRGTASAEVTQSELSDALGVPVVLTPGRAGVRVGGATVSASVAVRNGSLVFSGVRVPLPPLRVPQLPLLRCNPSAEVLDGLVRLSCRVDAVPQELLREAQRRLQSS